ncbi:hypothetical protein VDGL01_11928 [Verticillium dahliae]
MRGCTQRNSTGDGCGPSPANFVPVAVQQAEASVKRKPIGPFHTRLAGRVVARPRAADVPHGSGRRAAHEHKRPLVRVDLEERVVRRLSMLLRVQAAAPEADLRSLLEVRGHVERLLVEGALPVVRRDRVLVVVVPHAVDALLGELLNTLVPPVEAGLGRKVVWPPSSLSPPSALHSHFGGKHTHTSLLRLVASGPIRHSLLCTWSLPSGCLKVSKAHTVFLPLLPCAFPSLRWGLVGLVILAGRLEGDSPSVQSLSYLRRLKRRLLFVVRGWG